MRERERKISPRARVKSERLADAEKAIRALRTFPVTTPRRFPPVTESHLLFLLPFYFIPFSTLSFILNFISYPFLSYYPLFFSFSFRLFCLFSSYLNFFAVSNSSLYFLFNFFISSFLFVFTQREKYDWRDVVLLLKFNFLSD